MRRIIIHWTAGTGKANAVDKQHYHYIIERDGNIVPGKFPVHANEVCKEDLKGNVLYAAHCGGGNTGSIGVGLCGMAGYKSSKAVGKYPLTAVQVERAFKLIAELSKQYNILINPQTVMTHYEFGKKNPKTSSAGKIDIVYLPCYPKYAKDEIGNLFRSKAVWYKQRI